MKRIVCVAFGRVGGGATRRNNMAGIPSQKKNRGEGFTNEAHEGMKEFRSRLRYTDEKIPKHTFSIT